ncbi:caspase family protein [Rhodopseudomonas sp. HC1]|uniref:caspase family protein n=1 Tax=Rhodopseudomonas infernalis TaxID=2897386 RepID=UPI001EE968AF|nr:caspase family protein [Rhodopseudomonas infernalis]MCG6204560.1 caspase family protein [Rhodopseudomonas infernalis]
MRAIWTAAMAAVLVLGAKAAWAESRVALVVGQSAYRAVPALPNPANDAKAVEKLLGEAGFEVTAANDLTQTELRQMVGDFAAKIAAKGPDTVALMFYAGHGIQVDGENYLIPVDIDPKRETDIPLQAVRLDDVLNTLTSVPTRSRIIMLDACRNNPFPEIRKTTGQGLALVDTKTGSPGTFVSFSTSPGAEAEDGGGANSPYTTALLEAGRKSGLQIEDTFKRVRLAVNKATEGRQTPWDSSSLIDDFRFFGASEAAAQPEKKRTVEEWRSLLKGKKVEEANELIVSDGSVDAYEAFVSLFAEPPLGTQAKRWLDRHRRMQAWNKAVLANTASAYKTFLDQYPESDLTVTARKLELRLRNKPEVAVAVPVATSLGPTPVAALTPASGATCPCGAPPAIEKKADKKTEKSKPKRAERDEPKRTASKPPRGRVYYEDDVDDVVVVRRPPPDYYDVPRGPGISIGGGFRGGSIGPRGPTGGNIGGGGGRY